MTQATISALMGWQHEYEIRDGTALACRVRKYVVQSGDLDRFVQEAALAIASCYIAPAEIASFPTETARLPKRDASAQDKVRKGDFGEVLSHVLYRQIGFEVPISKLWSKPQSSTSQTGPDTIALAIRPPSAGRSAAANSIPIVIESKLRTGHRSPGELLGLLAKPDTPQAFREVARVGLNSLAAHPAGSELYAYAAATALAREDSCEIHVERNLEQHGVLIVEPDSLTKEQIEQRWGPDGAVPPRSRLSIIEVPDLENVVHRCFDAASEITAKEVAGLIGPISNGPIEHPGLLSPASIKLNHGFETGWSMTAGVIETALWFLSNKDGLARARLPVPTADTPDVGVCLVNLLSGESDFEFSVLDELTQAIQQAWLLPGPLLEDRRELERLLSDSIPALDEPWRVALQLVVQSIAYRLERNPVRATNPKPGTVLESLTKLMVARGRVALWPPQYKAISAGLLQSGPCPFIVNSPTSSGKTLLILLSAAASLDQHPDKQVIVIADRKAVVRQLQREFKKWLPATPCVRLTGEIEGDSTAAFPPSGGTGRILIATPERLDLDWRRTVTSESGIDPESHTSLAIADEAHHIGASKRGPRLEMLLARAMRAEIPIQLFSSQLAGLELLGSWIGHEDPVDDDWMAAPIEKIVFYRDEDERKGYLWEEYGDPRQITDLSQFGKKGQLLKATRSVAELASELAISEWRNFESLTLLFSAKRSLVPGLSGTLYKEIKHDGWTPAAELLDLADRLPPGSKQIAELLRVGVGMHHGAGTRLEREAVEAAARRGLLRFIVASPTLVSGVDLPVRSVVVAYPGRGAGADSTLPTADLLNLQGRAGRGGNFTAGRLIVMTTDEMAAARIRQTFHTPSLSPTRSQLVRSRAALRKITRNLPLTDFEEEALEDFDSTVLGVVLDGTLDEAQIRHELEEILGRTLFYAGSETDERLAILDAAMRRYQSFTNFPDGWSRTVYRTGLGVRSCNTLLEELSNLDRSVFRALVETQEPPSADLLLPLLAIALSTPTLSASAPSALSVEDRQEIARIWLAGDEAVSVSDEADQKLVAKTFEKIEGLGKWVVGAAIDILCWLENLDSDAVSLFHKELELQRVRSGTPSMEAAALEKLGLGRKRSNELWRAYKADGPGISFDEHLDQHLSPEELALLHESN